MNLSAPIGPLAMYLPAPLEIMTDRPSNQQTNMRVQRKVQFNQKENINTYKYKMLNTCTRTHTLKVHKFGTALEWLWREE